MHQEPKPGISKSIQTPTDKELLVFAGDKVDAIKRFIYSGSRTVVRIITCEGRFEASTFQEALLMAWKKHS
jgi:hypothetical protein